MADIRIPDPEQTPDGPAYEGRPLARPEEEVVDQGAGFDLGTLLSRRAVFSVLGLGAGTAVLAACAAGSSAVATPATGATPTETLATITALAPGVVRVVRVDHHVTLLLDGEVVWSADGP